MLMQLIKSFYFGFVLSSCLSDIIHYFLIGPSVVLYFSMEQPMQGRRFGLVFRYSFTNWDDMGSTPNLHMYICCKSYILHTCRHISTVAINVNLKNTRNISLSCCFWDQWQITKVFDGKIMLKLSFCFLWELSFNLSV